MRRVGARRRSVLVPQVGSSAGLDYNRAGVKDSTVIGPVDVLPAGGEEVARLAAQGRPAPTAR